jgi:hypothetical protein
MSLEGILATVFGIIAVISLVVTVKLARRKQPTWAYTTTKIIGLGSNAPEGLVLTFNGRPIQDVYRTTLMFFNKGNETIRAEDVKKTITIDFGQSSILREPEILKRSRDEIEFRAKKVASGPNQSVELNFSFLDSGDGAVIEVLHTDKGPKECRGTIMGAKKIGFIKDFIPSRPRQFVPRCVVATLFVLVPTGLLIYGCVLAVSARPGDGASWIILGALWDFVAVPTVLSFFRYARFPKWALT